VSDAQKLTEREAEVLWAIRGFFESNRYKTDLNFVEVLEACPENIVAGILRPILEHLQTLRFLRQDPDGLFSLTPTGLGFTDKRDSLTKSTFTAFCDLLLVALADHSGQQGNKSDIFDLRSVAQLYGLDFTPGWIGRASEVFEKRGWAKVSRVMSFGQDGGFDTTLSGDGLLKAEELKNEFIKSGVTPPSYSPPDGSLAVKASTSPSDGTTPVSIGGDSAFEAQGNSGSIPASDRFVTRSDNIHLFEEAEQELEALTEAIRTANDLKVTADERLAIISEVEGVRALIRQPVVRIRAIYDAIRENSLLKWLAVAAGASVVGDKAVAAFNALLALVGL